jgi:transcriptional regulator with XRE-family HTH domain
MEPKPSQQALATVVVDELAEAKLSLRDVEERTGIAKSTMSRRLNGLSPFPVTELALLATVLGKSTSDLLARAEAATA